MDDKQLNTSSDTLLTEAVNETTKTTDPQDTESFIKKVGEQFLENKVRDFPNLCDETRRINFLQRKAFLDDGSNGWSESKDFKHDYTIPKELYNFMVNLIYRNFWEEDNEKVWRSFMKAILRGDEPMDLLKKVRMHYDTNINQLV